MTQISVFGIRHHGPGSARSLLSALDDLSPDIVLIEGPPDADGILPLARNEAMQPPISILVYQADTPRRCVYYPFAVFSPEWQAIQWALERETPVRFIDLPQYLQLPLDEAQASAAADPPADDHDSDTPAQTDTEADDAGTTSPAAQLDMRRDPLRLLAEAAGYSDGERWWDHMVEQRADGAEVFAAILEAMTALRAHIDAESSPIPSEERAGQGEGPGVRAREDMREAFMRQSIRAAQREGFARIAVVCGAWHAPVLVNPGPAKADKALLDGLAKVKTVATWIPWTNSRLSYYTGYGAGIESPGWYEHLWTRRGDVVVPWMIRVAGLLREQDLDASPASVIEAVRLAECLASLRGRPLPGLPELNEATQTVLCFGSEVPMQLISTRLIIGEALGGVPDDAPSVPLLQDVQRLQKRLRLPAEAGQKVIDMDLRREIDIERSELLHRLNLLGVNWGKAETAGAAKGTFHEVWRLQWHPEFAISVIEKGVWGNSVADAAAAYASDRANAAETLPDVTRLLKAVMLARLPDSLALLMRRLEDTAASSGDVAHLMAALPPLVDVSRYGDVRGTDTAMITHAIDGLVTRVCIGLESACSSLDDNAAMGMSGNIGATNAALALLQDEDHLTEWHAALLRLAEHTAGGGAPLHGLVEGRCTRILLDAGILDTATAGRYMGLALTTAVEPDQAAAWVEGFLAGAGMLLVHDRTLWDILDAWVAELPTEQFTPMLPLLRRTFSRFTAPERRMLGERAREGAGTRQVDVDRDINHARAALALPGIMRLLGDTK